MLKNTRYTEEQFAALYTIIEAFENAGYSFSKQECWGQDEEHMVCEANITIHKGNCCGRNLVRIRIINRHNGTDKDVNIGVDYYSGEGNGFGVKYSTIKFPIKCTERVYKNRLKKAFEACEVFKNLNGCFF